MFQPSNQKTKQSEIFSGQTFKMTVSTPCASFRIVLSTLMKLLFTAVQLVFALVTVSGSLIVYNRHVSMRALAKVAAHNGDASCLDFHPTQPFIIATGGSNDNRVKGMRWLIIMSVCVTTILISVL